MLFLNILKKHFEHLNIVKLSEDVNLAVCPFSGTYIIRATYHSDKWLLQCFKIFLISDT